MPRVPPPPSPIPLSEVEAFLHEAWIEAPGTTLRDEDRRKAREITALLPEALRALGHASGEALLVDVACGKGYLGLATAFFGRARGAVVRFHGIESDPRRAAQAREILDRLGLPGEVQRSSIREALLPPRPRLVVALHACGPATDEAIEAVLRVRARTLLCLPCCHRREETVLDGLLRHRGLLGASASRVLQDARRALRLEAGGYLVESLEAFPSSTSPHNLLLRARLDPEPGREARARAALERLDALLPSSSSSSPSPSRAEAPS
jgi:hypothetical protein